MSVTPPTSALSLLRNRSFAAVLAYRICALLSYQIVAVTVGSVSYTHLDVYKRQEY